ncbi:alaserpin-like isoform X4 [Aricia agestis]|uniref:alaserpin-like isoform X4 n=1 Tax=Aricia agestis TaxID=91739 RepID=UPI001C203157|nr:alaserpin-like isoform X4 [Aricia agestis]XP_041976280.1 alaserpin-like isoform X4 [Aricia agestis]
MLRLLLLCTVAVATMAEESELLTTATNQFTARMFSEIVKEKPDQSVVLSAFSVMPPLAQLALASVGESHDELLSNIGMPNDNVTKSTFSQLNSRLRSSKDIDLRMASKIYVAQNYELNSDFAVVSRDVFNSEVKNIDFVKNTESAAEINSWVEDQTNHRIKDLVDPSSLGGDTEAVLVNAIYFKGTWKYPFTKEATKEDDFHVSKDKTVKVQMMYNKEDYKYAESEELNAQVIEIPYNGDEASMLIVLPKEVDGIKQLEEKLKDPSILEAVTKKMHEREVELYLPKFKIETTTNLKEILSNMNIKKLFSGAARLDNLLKGKSGLYVSDAIQKAFIEVNEEGAEAAAANAFLITEMAYFPAVPTPVFKADRPFYFLIKNKSLTLFSGVKIQ